jgi:hypothetical protein
MAKEYSKFPTRGHIAEKINTERNENLVYHTEYKKAANSAAKDDAGVLWVWYTRNIKISMSVSMMKRGF